MAKTLSIIIPALNEAHRIESTLTSLAPARERGAQVVVVDGGSEDATVSIALRWADVVRRAPRGRASQLNAGAEGATGEILWFLHADSLPPAHGDIALVDAIGERAMAWGRFDVKIESGRRSLGIVAAMMNLRSRATGIATGDQGLFATRALFEYAGGFAPQGLMEDIEFCRAARRIALPINLRARIITSGRRWEQYGVARTVLLMWALRLAYFLGADPDSLAARYERGR